MKRLRRPWRWVLLAVVLGGGATPIVLRAIGPSLPVDVVVPRELVQTVVASGRVLPPARVSIGALSTTTVARVLVEEGQAVRAGDLLVELSSSVEQAAIQQALAGVAQAQARLQQVVKVSSRIADEGRRQAEVGLKRAEEKHERARRLAAQGAVSQAELDDATRSLELARSQAQSASIQAAGSAARGAEAQALAAALLQARAALAGAEARLAQTRLCSSVEGVVLSRAVEPGDLVLSGKTLLVLAKNGPTQLVFQPEEKNLALLRVGQRARASADAFPDDLFEAVVSTIAPAVDPLRGTVEVKLRVPSPPPFLRPDMTVSVNVEVARRQGVLVARASAVHDVASGKPWVFVAKDGRVERRPVAIGLRGEGLFEITRGLSRGELLLLAPKGALAHGQRVRPSLSAEAKEVRSAL
jgi:HlyD family secretion protein